MTSKSRLADMYRRPGFLLKRCHQVAMAIFLEESRAFNITQSQYGCLRALQAYPGVDQIALGRLVGLDRSTSAMVIKTLSDRGLIRRVVDRRDRRRMRLELTAQGGRVLDDMAAAAGRAQERVLAAVPRGSRTAFLDMLESFLAGHDALIDPDQVLAGLPTTRESSRGRQRDLPPGGAAASRAGNGRARAK
jgi:DNA-binding MarR family transcriptional regulator